jgi:hypothetical protein
MPTCQLCLQEKEKLCKAHLLPEAFYRFIRFDEDSLLSIPGNEKLPFTTTIVGRWDDQILCMECDQKILGKLDDYAAKVMLERKFSMHWCQRPELTYFSMRDVNVAAIKLFWISVLWRHAVSKQSENQGIQLPEESIETIRGMILRGDPGTPEEFSVVLLYFGSPQVIMALSRAEGDDGWFDYYVCGWHVWIKGSRTETRTAFRTLFLDPQSETRVVVQNMDDTPKLFDIILSFVKVDEKEANRAYGEYQKRLSIGKSEEIG